MTNAVAWFVHENIVHPFLEILAQTGWALIRYGNRVHHHARKLHDATVPALGARPRARR